MTDFIQLNPREAIAWVEKNWPTIGYGPFPPGFHREDFNINTSGVYFLYQGGGVRPVYVGISKRAAERIRAHSKDPRMTFDRVAFVLAPIECARLMEAVFLEALDPPLNRQWELTDWARHDEAVEAVSRAWNVTL